MSKKGYLFRKGPSWFLRYRQDSNVNGELVRAQKMRLPC